MAPIIDVRDLVKRYGSAVAVDGVSFTVDEGEIFGILGPNGAGKTTTVECLQGLRPFDDGTVRVLGFDPRAGADALRRLIGSQLQESALPDRMKVWEALDLFSALVPGGPPWQTTMRAWGLDALAGATFGSLSGGQRQRLLVALAVVNEPRLVFLDEMTTGLDPTARRATWDLIRRVRSGGTTVVVVTHFMDEAEALCDRVAIIDGKRVIAIDTPAGLIEQHGGPVTVTFTSEAVDLGFLERIDGVDALRRDGRRVTIEGSGPIVALVGATLVGHGIVPADLDVARPTLEDVFLSLTGGPS